MSTKDIYVATRVKFSNFELGRFSSASNFDQIPEEQKIALAKVDLAFHKAKLAITSKMLKPNGDPVDHSENDMELLMSNMISAMRACNTFKKLIIEDFQSNDEQLEPFDTMEEAIKHLDTEAQKAYGSKKYRDIGRAMDLLSKVLLGAALIASAAAFVTAVIFPPLLPIFGATACALFGSALVTTLVESLFSKVLLSKVGSSIMDLKVALHPFKNQETLATPVSFFSRLAGNIPAPQNIVKFNLAP